MAVRIFMHGLESSNQGTKSVFFRERYPDMIIPLFTGSLEERMEELDRILSDQTGIVLVGSSFGGLMGAIFAMEHESRVEKLVLLAPAINLLDATSSQQKRISVPAWIYHGRNDDVIPLKEVEQVAGEIFAHLSFHVVDDDHFLHKTFKTLDWDSLLS